MITLRFKSIALCVSLAVAGLVMSGCVQVSYESHDGQKTTKVTYSSPAFGSKGIASADFQKGIVKGVTSEQSSMAEMFSAVYQAGLAAGTKAVAP